MPVRQVVYVGIMALCAAVMVIQLIKGRGRALTSILFRLTGGAVGVFCANSLLGLLGGAAVGLNLFTLMLIGALGTPGFILLYVISNLKFL